MATAYKANVLKRYVAVKVLRDEFTTDEEFIKRFTYRGTISCKFNSTKYSFNLRCRT